MEGGNTDDGSNQVHADDEKKEIALMYKTGFPLGGCLFLLFTTYICWFVFELVKHHIERYPTSYSVSISSQIDKAWMLDNPLNMTEFEESFNLMFGVNHLEKDFNLLDNDYFQIKAFTF